MTHEHLSWRRRTILRAAALALTAGGLVGLQAAPSYAAPISPAPTPVLSGLPKAGETVFIDAGEWPSGTALSYEWLLDGVTEPGAVGPSWQLRQVDIDVSFQVAVTGTRAGFDDTRVLSEPVTILGEQQALTPTPTVAGTPRVGEQLVGTVGAWDPGTTQALQWLRGDAPIAGATAASYTPTTQDLGSVLALRVTSTRPGYSKVVRASGPTAPVAGPLTLLAGGVAVTGTPRFGQTLTAVATGWPAGAALAYQWLRGGSPIAGATSPSYVAGLADLGAPLSVRVTGSRPGYVGASTTSAPTAAVSRATLAAGTVRIAGRPQVGRTLRARPTGFDAGAALAYRWLVGSKVVGTKPALTLARKAAGKRVVLQVTATLPGYESRTASSARSGKVKPASKSRR